jgi:transposase
LEVFSYGSYSFDFKLKVVNAYLSGVGGFQFLSDKYGLPSKETVLDWVNAYHEFGALGLQRKRQNTVYDFNFKLHAVNLYLTSEKSYREVAHQLGLNNRALLARWEVDYRQKGEFTFVPKLRGRSRKEGNVSQSKSKKPKEELSEL